MREMLGLGENDMGEGGAWVWGRERGGCVGNEEERGGRMHGEDLGHWIIRHIKYGSLDLMNE